ncbi:MAG: hypothetical protein AAF384_03255 [Pseudomonadota bacterium]
MTTLFGLDRGSALLWLSGLVILTWIVYWPALSGPLILDDSKVVTPFLLPDGVVRYADDPLVSATGPLGRPLAMLSFKLDAALHGDRFAGWKATNLVIHILVGVLIYGFCVALWRSLGYAVDGARTLGLFTSAIWLLHPLLLSTSMYLVQRMTQLSMLFVVLGLWLYALGRWRSDDDNQARWQILSAFLLCTPLACLAKETGALLPLYLWGYEYFIVQQAMPVYVARTFVVFLVIPALTAALIMVYEPAFFFSGYAIRDFTLSERLLTESRVLVSYLAMLMAPGIKTLGFFHDDFIVSSGWASPPSTILSVLLIVAVAGAGFRWRKQIPAAAFGLYLFGAGHLLESTIFPLELMFEHRNYLPGLGVAIATIGMVSRCIGFSKFGRAVALTMVITLAFLTADRAIIWSSESFFFAHAAAQHPRSARARVSYAEWLTSTGNHKLALSELRRLEHFDTAVHALRVLCERDGALPRDALSRLADQLGDETPSAFSVDVLELLAYQTVDGHCELDGTLLADILATLAVLRMPNLQRIKSFAASALLRASERDFDAALVSAMQAYALDKTDPMPLFMASEYALDGGYKVKAQQLLDEAMAVAGEHVADYRPLIEALRELLSQTAETNVP